MAIWTVLVLLAIAGPTFEKTLADPNSLHDIAARFDPVRGRSTTPDETNATPIPFTGRIVIPAGEPLRYDSTRDATLVGARVCGHAACGPLIWLRGDWRDGIPRPQLLTTDAERLTLVSIEPTGQGRFGFIDNAIDEPFEANDPRPTLLGRVALRVIPLFLLAIPLTASPMRRAAATLGPALGTAAGWTTSGMGLAAIGLGMLALATGLIGAILLLAYGITKRRILPEGLALLLFAIAFITTATIVDPWNPTMGWGD